MRLMLKIKIFCVGMLLFSIAALAPSTVAAEEWISGRVQGVDRNRGILTLALSGQGKTVRVVAVSGRTLKRIRPGATIQAWGHYQRPDQNLFLAQRIVRIDNRKPHSDPTGVRKRLHRRFRP